MMFLIPYHSLDVLTRKLCYMLSFQNSIQTLVFGMAKILSIHFEVSLSMDLSNVILAGIFCHPS